MSTKTRIQILVPKEEASILKLSAFEWSRSLADHIVDSAQIFSFTLTDGIICKISHINEVKKHTDFWRIDIEFIESRTGYYLRSGWYELWASHEFIEDFLHLTSDKTLTKIDIAQFAYQFISKRYKDNNNELPKEYGAFCSNETGIKFVDASGTLLTHFESLSGPVG